MGKYFHGLQVKYLEKTLVLQFDAALRDGDPEKVEAFLAELVDECRRRLPMQLMCGPTHRECMSMRIKRGIKAAKERRRQQQQPQ